MVELATSPVTIFIMKYFNIARSETGSPNDGATFLGTVATVLDEEVARRKIDNYWKVFVDTGSGEHEEFVEFLCENSGDFVWVKSADSALPHVLC